MNLAHWLARRSKEDPFRPALFSGRTLVSDYGGFDMQARAVASWLLGQGVGPGDRVAIFMKNIPDYLVVLFGIWYAGAAAVPVNAKLHGREADYILDDADAKIVFASASQGATLTARSCAAIRLPKSHPGTQQSWRGCFIRRVPQASPKG